MRQPAEERNKHSADGWALFAGLIVGLALVKEVLRRVRDNPVAAQAREVSRTDTALSLAALLRTFQRIGASVLGARSSGW